jgi:hypothetical protein
MNAVAKPNAGPEPFDYDYVEVPNEPAAAPPSQSSRDPRGLNRLDPEIRGTHYQLVTWAKMAGTDNPGIGWKRCSQICRLLLVPGQGGAPMVDISEDDLATDAAVAHLGDIDRRVVWAYYVDWHKARDGQWWRLLTGMKERQAYNVLNRARWRINGYRACWHDNKK